MSTAQEPPPGYNVQCPLCETKWPKWHTKAAQVVTSSGTCPLCGPQCCEKVKAARKVKEVHWISIPGELGEDNPSLTDLPTWAYRDDPSKLYSRISECPFCATALPGQ